MGLPKPNAGGINKYSNLEPGAVASDHIRTKHARMLTEVGPLRTVLYRVVLRRCPTARRAAAAQAGLDLLVAWFWIGEACYQSYIPAVSCTEVNCQHGA